jgi:hypothetical protein
MPLVILNTLDIHPVEPAPVEINTPLEDCDSLCELASSV